MNPIVKYAGSCGSGPVDVIRTCVKETCWQRWDVLTHSRNSSVQMCEAQFLLRGKISGEVDLWHKNVSRWKSQSNASEGPLQLFDGRLLRFLDTVVNAEGQNDLLHRDLRGRLVHQEICVPEGAPWKSIHLQILDVVGWQFVHIGVSNDEPLPGHMETPILCLPRGGLVSAWSLSSLRCLQAGSGSGHRPDQLGLHRCPQPGGADGR